MKRTSAPSGSRRSAVPPAAVDGSAQRLLHEVQNGTSARALAGTRVHVQRRETAQYPARTCPPVSARARLAFTRLSLVMKGPQFESERRLENPCLEATCVAYLGAHEVLHTGKPLRLRAFSLVFASLGRGHEGSTVPSPAIVSHRGKSVRPSAAAELRSALAALKLMEARLSELLLALTLERGRVQLHRRAGGGRVREGSVGAVQLATAQRATPGSSHPHSVAKGTNASLSRALSSSRSSSGSARSTIANGPATSITHCS